MLFNSTEFLAFFGLFLAAYALIGRYDVWVRNALVVLASYVFYSAWDYRFTALLFFTSTLDFTVARFMEGAGESRRRGLVSASIALNLGVLGVFKYYNFFRQSFETLLTQLGLPAHWQGWQIVLPVGLSFYTFQSMSYVMDVYRREIPACRNFLQFLAYDSFFPQLVAGPIGRGSRLLPQFAVTRKITVEALEAGVWLATWGMFKKVVLADNLAPLVDLVYQNNLGSGPMVLLGTAAFGLQIYCDFSGYSDIACGLARVLGFELDLNFNLPYFATSLRDFWRRWHISLSTWLRDYLYIPLGGSRRSSGVRTYINLGLTMLLGGLWHGAGLNFLLWGLWHGAGLMVNRWWQTRRPLGWSLPAWAGWACTQSFVLVGWMFFRAGSLETLLQLSSALGQMSLPPWWRTYAANLLVLASPLLAMQLWQWRKGKLDASLELSGWARAVLQGVLLVLILACWTPEASPFIYFQF